MRKLTESLLNRPGFLVPPSRYRDWAIFAHEYKNLANLTPEDEEEEEEEFEEDEDDEKARTDYFEDGYDKLREEMANRKMLVPQIATKEGQKNFIYHPRKYLFSCGCSVYFPRICKEIILQKGVLCASPIKARYCATHIRTATSFQEGYESERMVLIDNQPDEIGVDEDWDDDRIDMHDPDYSVLNGEKVIYSTTHTFHWTEVADLVTIARGMAGDANSARNIEACKKYLQNPPSNFMERRSQSLTGWGSIPRILVAVPRSIFEGVTSYLNVPKAETEDFEKALNRMLGIITLKPRIRIEIPRFIIRRKKERALKFSAKSYAQMSKRFEEAAAGLARQDLNLEPINPSILKDLKKVGNYNIQATHTARLATDCGFNKQNIPKAPKGTPDTSIPPAKETKPEDESGNDYTV